MLEYGAPIAASDGLVWRRFPHACHAARLFDGAGGGYWLTVEALDGGGWEWLVWSAELPSRCRHGRAISLAEAQGDCELAGRALALDDLAATPAGAGGAGIGAERLSASG